MEWETDDDTDYTEDEDEPINVYINKFPVQMICLEKCEGTLDELLENKILNENECISSLFQIVMTLVLYQKTFHFTHNDLHTNNIVYNTTDEEFIYYKHNKKTYRVPTYGRIYKIIDFGRSIYSINGHLLCSDSFGKDGDATTQYNDEPFFNEKKPRIKPNYSFDLCRLACSIYDFLFDNYDNEQRINEKNKNSFQKIIVEWCKDNKGRNILYKQNGDERYPQFKLYKMIARNVFHCVPEEQLHKPIFNRYEITAESVPPLKHINDFDTIPEYHSA